MIITITYELDKDKIAMIEDILEVYEPSDFKNEDDKDVFLNDIALNLIDVYPFLSEEIITDIIEEYLKEKEWIK